MCFREEQDRKNLFLNHLLMLVSNMITLYFLPSLMRHSLIYPIHCHFLNSKSLKLVEVSKAKLSYICLYLEEFNYSTGMILTNLAHV